MNEDQREQWRKALAAHAAAQRRRRVTYRVSKRVSKVASYTPGMTRRQPPTARQDGQR